MANEFLRMAQNIALDLDVVKEGERPSKLEVRFHVAQTPPGHVARARTPEECGIGRNAMLYGACIVGHYEQYPDETQLAVLDYVPLDSEGPTCCWCSMMLKGHLR